MSYERTCIIYSSRTGNTEKVGVALSSALQIPLFSVTDAPPLDGYETVVLGFWVRRAFPDEAMLHFMESVMYKDIFFFCTHAAWPDSEHIRKCCSNVRELLERTHNSVIGCFTCQGAVRETGRKHHPMTEDRRARLAEAAHHPNQEDFSKAVQSLRLALENR